ncbi:biopolymer transporter ExbD [Marispirochaeta aestuarii]|uniref:Biopolymer transporter ExbD n=1 Tax=Marispirochaeta aestuarii TaxID=1963862 RepID=A0A1Y1S3K0_9SPIO|nr:biopolymer transporter ExbD [Marispirochaeta aestuarii]ORC38246.1 biopolymer transporter ExbD [Marispirochaeta aestuarii]
MQFRRRLKTNATVDLVPMIDVVFQLVIFFMVSTTFILTPGINLSLPESSTAEPVAASRIVITVAGEEEIYINKERVTLDGLVPILQGMRESSDIGNVVLEGDRQVPYAMLIQVLDRLRAAGFSGANLRTLEPGGG